MPTPLTFCVRRVRHYSQQLLKTYINDLYNVSIRTIQNYKQESGRNECTMGFYLRYWINTGKETYYFGISFYQNCKKMKINGLGACIPRTCLLDPPLDWWIPGTHGPFANTSQSGISPQFDIISLRNLTELWDNRKLIGLNLTLTSIQPKFSKF